MSEKLKRMESLTLEKRIIGATIQVCRIMKDLDMIDMEYHCLCSSKIAFNEWNDSKLKTSKGHIFFSLCITRLWNHSSQEPIENEKRVSILIKIRNTLCLYTHILTPTHYTTQIKKMKLNKVLQRHIVNTMFHFELMCL